MYEAAEKSSIRSCRAVPSITRRDRCGQTVGPGVPPAPAAAAWSGTFAGEDPRPLRPWGRCADSSAQRPTISARSMGTYLVRRLLLAIPTMAIVYTVASSWCMRPQAAPGTTLRSRWRTGDRKYQAEVPFERTALEPVRSLPSGRSPRIARPSYVNAARDVAEIIEDFFPISLQLGAVAMLFAIALGIPLGTLAAVYRNTPWIMRRWGSW